MDGSADWVSTDIEGPVALLTPEPTLESIAEFALEEAVQEEPITEGEESPSDDSSEDMSALVISAEGRQPLPVGPVLPGTLDGAVAGRMEPSPCAADVAKEPWMLWPAAPSLEWGRRWDGSTESGMTERSAPQFEGDETLLGPDGDLYDVFYPGPDGEFDAAAEVRRDEGILDKCMPAPSLQQSSAESGIADVVAYMRTAVVARYPARALFFLSWFKKQRWKLWATILNGSLWWAALRYVSIRLTLTWTRLRIPEVVRRFGQYRRRRHFG